MLFIKITSNTIIIGVSTTVGNVLSQREKNHSKINGGVTTQYKIQRYLRK